ncbi:DUF2887 domain-containing protein [Nostoc sp.]
MKTDAIFYDIFQQFPSILFELIGQSNTKMLMSLSHQKLNNVLFV